jgi:hypothetical protein
MYAVRVAVRLESPPRTPPASAPAPATQIPHPTHSVPPSPTSLALSRTPYRWRAACALGPTAASLSRASRECAATSVPQPREGPSWAPAEAAPLHALPLMHHSDALYVRQRPFRNWLVLCNVSLRYILYGM